MNAHAYLLSKLNMKSFSECGMEMLVCLLGLHGQWD